jgi:hypothetical protein
LKAHSQSRQRLDCGKSSTTVEPPPASIGAQVIQFTVLTAITSGYGIIHIQDFHHGCCTIEIGCFGVD